MNPHLHTGSGVRGERVFSARHPPDGRATHGQHKLQMFTRRCETGPRDLDTSTQASGHQRIWNFQTSNLADQLG